MVHEGSKNEAAKAVINMTWKNFSVFMVVQNIHVVSIGKRKKLRLYLPFFHARLTLHHLRAIAFEA